MKPAYLQRWKSANRTLRVFELLVLGLLWLFLHMPFLFADATPEPSIRSRGQWTDEGVNTSQVRNFINHGTLNLVECDNFLKTPLFSALLYTPLVVFGSHLHVARLVVVALVFCFSVVPVYLQSKKWGLALHVVGLLVPPVFEQSHLAMAEMVACSLTTCAVVVLANGLAQKNRKKLVLGTVLLGLVVGIKIQFVYLLALPACAVLAHNLLSRNTPLSQPFGVVVALSLGLVAAAFSFIYLPFTQAWAVIIPQQSGSLSLEKFTAFGLAKNVYFVFFKSFPVALFTAAFLFAVYRFAATLIKHRSYGLSTTLSNVALLWFALETHKLAMHYLPVRYAIGIYVAMGLFLATSWATAYTAQVRVPAPFLLVAMVHVGSYAYSRSHRTFDQQHVNTYLNHHLQANDVLLGPWAPSFSWSNNSRAYPIWDRFEKSLNPVATYLPKAIVAEPDEADSGQAFSKRNIQLEAISDSVKQFQVAHWTLNVYWISNKKAGL